MRPHERPLFDDTDPRTRAFVDERFRTMSPAEKLAIVQRLSREVIALSRAGVRARHPGITEREVELRAASLRLSRETMVRAFGWDPEREGYG